jgi:hypothetical protein
MTHRGEPTERSRQSATEGQKEPQGGYKIAPGQSSFRSEHGQPFASCDLAWSSAVLSDLQMKLEKYERKAAQYEKAAQQATDGPERALYEGLASYCDELAEKFRQVIAKRTGVSLAAE